MSVGKGREEPGLSQGTDSAERVWIGLETEREAGLLGPAAATGRGSKAGWGGRAAGRVGDPLQGGDLGHLRAREWEGSVWSELSAGIWAGAPETCQGSEDSPEGRGQ